MRQIMLPGLVTKYLHVLLVRNGQHAYVCQPIFNARDDRVRSTPHEHARAVSNRIHDTAAMAVNYRAARKLRRRYAHHVVTLLFGQKVFYQEDSRLPAQRHHLWVGLGNRQRYVFRCDRWIMRPVRQRWRPRHQRGGNTQRTRSNKRRRECGGKHKPRHLLVFKSSFNYRWIFTRVSCGWYSPAACVAPDRTRRTARAPTVTASSAISSSSSPPLFRRDFAA